MRGEISSKDKTATEEFLSKLAKIIEGSSYILDQEKNAKQNLYSKIREKCQWF